MNSVIRTCETFVKISQTKLNIYVLRMCSWHQKYMHDVLINIPSVGHFLKSHFMHVFLIIRCNNYHLPTSVKYKNSIPQETAFSKQCDARRIFLRFILKLIVLICVTIGLDNIIFVCVTSKVTIMPTTITQYAGKFIRNKLQYNEQYVNKTMYTM